MALSDTFFFFPNRNNCQIYKHRFYWCIFLRTGCRKDAFTSWNLTQEKSFVRIPDERIFPYSCALCLPLVFCPPVPSTAPFWCKKPCFPSSLKCFSSWCFPSSKFSVLTSIWIQTFCALSNQYMHFQAFVSVITYHLSGPPAKTNLPSTFATLVAACSVCELLSRVLLFATRALWPTSSSVHGCARQNTGTLAVSSSRRSFQPGFELMSRPLLYHCTSWQKPHLLHQPIKQT